MSILFRVKLKDKLLHVTEDVQRELHRMENVGDLLTLPNHVELQVAGVEAIKSMGFVPSETITKNFISFQLRTRMLGTIVILVGTAFTNWDSPDSGTLADAEWRFFEIQLVNTKQPNVNIPAKLSKILHVTLNINYIQKFVTNEWCDFMVKFPVGCEEVKAVEVPGWIPERHFQLLIKKTIELNRAIKLEDNDKTLFTNDELKTIKFCPASRNELMSLSTLCNALNNLDLERREAETGGLGAIPRGRGRPPHLLDQENPILRNAEQLLPRSPLPPPPPPTGPTARIGPRMFAALRAAYPHLSGKTLMDAAQRFRNSEEIFENLDQLPSKEQGSKHNLNQWPHHDHDHRGVDHDPLAGQDHVGVQQEAGYCKQPHLKDHVGGQDSRVRPANLRFQQDKEHIFVPEAAQRLPYQRPENGFPGEMRNLVGPGSKTHSGCIDPLGHEYERIVGEPGSLPTFQAKFPPSLHHQDQDRHHQDQDWHHHDQNQDQDWHQQPYLGPTSPQRLKERRQTDQREQEKREQLDLQRALKSNLQNIHDLEQNINQRIYGRPREEPTSILSDTKVIYATEDPSLLAPDVRGQIKVMHEVLDLMKDVRQHHAEIMEKLDEDVPSSRRSSRLSQKDRLDYNKMNRYGY